MSSKISASLFEQDPDAEITLKKIKNKKTTTTTQRKP
jgi:hypothetical protein